MPNIKGRISNIEQGMSNCRRGKALDPSSFIPIDIRYSSESSLTCSIFDILFLKPAQRALSSRGYRTPKTKLRLVGYIVDDVKYWIATYRFDLTGEEIALIYKLRWQVEKNFKWWKQHRHVYHLIARSEYGVMVRILTGLITYLLLAIYCQEQHGEKVSIKMETVSSPMTKNPMWVALTKHSLRQRVMAGLLWI